MKNLINTLLFISLLIAFNPNNLTSQLNINATIIPPYPTDLDFYLEDLSNVFVNISNPGSGGKKDFYLQATIKGPGEITAELKYQNLFSIEAGQVMMLTGNQLAELGRVESNFTYSSSLSQDQINAITINKVLPEGNYSICFEAYDRDQNLISDPSTGCAEFQITYVERPWIFTPETNDIVPEIPTISWSHDLSNLTPQDRNRITYRLTMIDATINELGMTIDEIMDHSYAGSYTYETKATTLSVLPGVDAILERGHEYVTFVTAIDDEGRLMFYDRGNSNLVSFFYKEGPDDGEGEEDDDIAVNCITEEGSSADCQNPDVDFYFPSHKDTIPFIFIPFLVRYDPYCPEYRNLVYNFAVTDLTTGQIKESNSGDNRWGEGGPYQYLLDHDVPGANTDQARIFMLSSLGPTTDDSDFYIRGHEYEAGARTVMTLSDGSQFTETNTINFVNGMPEPYLYLPKDQDTLDPGSVTFRWDNGALPENSFPDIFWITRMQGSAGVVEYALFGEVSEKWVLQVSKSENFERSDILAGLTHEILVTSFSSIDDLKNGIYVINEKVLELEDEADYYWRVVWLRDFNFDPTLTNYYVEDKDFYHKSPVHKFTLLKDSDSGGESAEEETTESACSSPCVFPAIEPPTASSGVAAGSTFQAAGFTIEVRESTGGTSSNGVGYVRIPFLNNIKVRVNFSGVSINSNRQMVTGTIDPAEDEEFEMMTVIHDGIRMFGMNEAEADALDASYLAGGKLVNLLSPGSEVTLPIGIDRDIDGNQIVIGIPNMTIKKDTAHMDIIVNLDLPNMDVLNGFLSLGAQVCITPNGFGNDVRLYLPQDQVFELGGGNEVRIKGASSTSDIRDITSVEWDCNGFRALNLTGAVRFTRDWIVPENEDGTIHPTNRVEARFGGRVVNGGHVMLRLDMDRFQIRDVEGWGFRLQNGYIDLSDLENPTELRANLPRDYHHAAFNSGGEANTWKGFYLQALEVRTPESFRGSTSDRLTFALRNMIIDETGISFSARAENVLRWDGNGDLNGWSASLDTIHFDIVQNNFRSFGLKGQIGLPIADNTSPTSRLRYVAMLNHEASNFELIINIRPANNIRIPISIATAVIRDDSYITTVIGQRSIIEADISATLSLGSSNIGSGGPSMPSTFSLPGLVVEHLRINSETGFDGREFRYSLTGMDSWGTSGTRLGGPGDLGDDDQDLGDLLPPSGSTESSLSGFPIGLEHFSISNEGISIEPRITLSADGTGIAASARILLRISVEDGFRSFSLTGIDLERISLNVETSDLKLAGYLEFYKEAPTGGRLGKEGVRGGILLEVNLGTRIGAQINADFGVARTATARNFDTPEWYSYFAVDGLLYISSGITLFTGVSLYGLGGGFYYHMRPNSASGLPSGQNVVTSPERSEQLAESELSEESIVPDRPYDSRQSSGVQYVNDWETLFGFQFMVILGSNDMGKAYNLDVKLEARFGPTGGMIFLGFTGTARVMTDGISFATINKGQNSPIAAYANITLSMPAHGPTIFDGTFFVKLALPLNSPMLAGTGTLTNPPDGWTSENTLVMAEIHFGPDKWYINLGTPTNRSGIRLKIGAVELLRLTNYIMIGDDVPLTLPAPDSAFMKIFNKGMGRENQVRSLDGPIENVLEGNPRPTLPTGSGFAFGLSMMMSTGDIEFFPFFFNLTAVLGCDINYTYASPDAERKCDGTDQTPGVDGWYASGQFYAGISGAFGIKINLFIAEIKVTILEASAAIILRGGLPKPEWVSGRGSFYYSVCDGLASGNCSFSLEAGTVCNTVTGNPFAGIDIIQDIEPENGKRDVSIYTNADAAFSFEMNKVYEFPQYTTDVDPPRIRYIEPYLHSFEIKKEGTTITFPGVGTWNEKKNVYHFVPNNRLEPTSPHKITVIARIREYIDGVPHDLMSRGRVFEEVKTSIFNTGVEPPKIVPENLLFTYPYINQRQFLKGETILNHGVIVCKSGNNTFFKNSTEPNITTSFVARLTPEHGSPIEIPAIIIGDFKGVKFKVDGLANEKLYCVQIIRKDLPPRPPVSLGDALANDFNVNASFNSDALQIVNFARTIGNSTLYSNQYKRVTLPAGTVNDHEREIFVMYFKTSKYNTFRQKMESQGAWEYNYLRFLYDIPELGKTLDENFEFFDVNEFKVIEMENAKRFTKRVMPYLEPPASTLDGITSSTIITENQYLKNVILPRIAHPNYLATLYRQNFIERIRRSGSFIAQTLIPYIPEIILEPAYSSFNEKVSIRSDANIASKLHENEIISGFTEYYGSNIGNGSVNSGLLSLITIPFVPPSEISNKTYIQYLLHLEGAKKYKRLVDQIVRFNYGRVNYQGLTTELSTYTTPTERAFFNEHMLRNNLNGQVNYTQINIGRHTFGMRYVFPDFLGNDHNGTMHVFNFNFSR